MSDGKGTPPIPTNTMTPPAQAAEIQAAEATTRSTTDEVEAATPAKAGERNPPSGDRYKQEVANLIDAYEQKQARLARERQEKSDNEPPPEPQGLLEGESWDAIYSSQPPEVQRAMAEMRKMVTQKTQALAAEQRKLEAQNKALVDSGLLEDLSRQAGTMPDDFDPFNPEHLQQVIEAKVAARLKQVLDPLKQRHENQEARNKYMTFREAHPDLVENDAIKQGVYKALQADTSLRLEAAYWMVKGQMLDAQERSRKEQDAVRRRAAQRAAQMPGSGRRPGHRVQQPDLKDQPAWKIYETLKAQRE